MSSRVKSWIHWFAAGVALGLGVLCLIFPSWQTSVALLVWLSVYAIFASHLAAAEAARPDPEIMCKLKQIQEQVDDLSRAVHEIRNRT